MGKNLPLRYTIIAFSVIFRRRLSGVT
jgi:hypothetical protein